MDQHFPVTQLLCLGQATGGDCISRERVDCVHGRGCVAISLALQNATDLHLFCDQPGESHIDSIL